MYNLCCIVDFGGSGVGAVDGWDNGIHEIRRILCVNFGCRFVLWYCCAGVVASFSLPGTFENGMALAMLYNSRYPIVSLILVC